MARSAAAGQVSAGKQGCARCRTIMIAAALIVALGSFADVHQANAQYVPMAPPQRPPYPTYPPYPYATQPPGQVAEPAVTRGRVERADTRRRVGRLHRKPRELVPGKRAVAERGNVSRSGRNVGRNERKVRRAASQRTPVKPVENQREAAAKNGYKRVSDLVNFPKFFPGLGIIYVKPDTLPTGPYLCFDRKDQLVATVYMVSINDIDDHKALDAAGVSGPVDHVSFYFNPGHPGMDMPHYHFVIWHVSKKDEARVAQ
ncbi:hypothetical protein [Bradyrhizobium sp.]|uniref:hypothetical protein n=1 Tax=Bradyrhizobium sp. TaxID=376 RepID=UPI00262243A1|nr:hypothetical protein [Bradyrhizobium sp.]